MKKNRVILGIDPGYDRLGWGVCQQTGNKLQVLAYGCVQTNKKDPLYDRYQELIDTMEEVLTKYQPQELAIEKLFFSRNTTTAIKVAEIRGLVITLALKANLTITDYGPNQIKLATTGYGKADKKAVEKMVRLQLNLQNTKIIDDTLDALGVCLTHSVST
jgi:crossover junction endodeoxyribonuclease RuvC